MKIMCFAGGGDIGGAKTHILSLGYELAKDNDFCLVCFRPGMFAESARALGLNVIVAEQAWNLIDCLRVALKAVDDYNPDIIHCHGAKANMFGVLVKKLRHVPVLTTVHSDPKRDYMGSPVKQAIFGNINQFSLKYMDFYMAVSETMETDLIKNGIDPQKIFVVYNGFDFSDGPKNERRQNQEDEVVVGIAARLTPIKNIPTVLRSFALAYERDHRLRLKIAGTGEEEQELRSLAQQLHIDHRVDFVGWVSDMRAFFADVDINVLASFSEGFPYSLLEGAAEKCATIATAVGGTPALIEHGKTGLLFEPLQVELFAEYIYRLSTQPELRSKLADNLYERAKENFSLQTMCQTQKSIYLRVLQHRAEKKQRHGVVICGAYGRGNAGDEAILQAITAQMREIDANMPLTVLSRNKMETRLKNKTNAIYIFNVFQFIRSLRSAKLFINGGGSLIQDVTSSRSLYFYLFTLWAAKHSGCHVIMYGCGIGPIRHGFNQKLAAYVLDHNVERITLRDSNSLSVLRSIGVDKPVVQLSADPTVNLIKSQDVSGTDVFAKENVPVDVPKVAFCVRNWPSFDNYQAIAQAADYVYNKHGFLPVFIPIELPKDVDAAAKITALMSVPYHALKQRYTVHELIGMLGDMKLVVGMRLHSLIFSTIATTPVVGLSYDIKVKSFLHDIGSTLCQPVEDINVESLIAMIDSIVNNGCPRAMEAHMLLRHGEDVNIAAARALLEV